MPNLNGTKVGSWKSNFGQADITLKSRIGTGYKNELEAQKAIVKTGEQGAIIREKDGRFSAYKLDDGAYLDDLDLGEKVNVNAKGKAAGVVDFVGDDGATLEKGQYMQAPIGRDNGETVYFMRALNNAEKGWKSRFVDPLLGVPNKLLQQDEILLARAKGYTVVIDNTATSQDMREAFYNQDTAGVVYLGHGGGGDIATYEKYGWLGPEDLDKKQVSKKLDMTYFQACQVSKKEDKWEETLGCEVYGWKRNATNIDVILANSGSTLIPGSGDLLNPYVWMGETLSQAMKKNL